MGGDQRGAGAAAAGAGDPGAALPDAQPDLLAVADRGDADIGALGKQRVMFEDRPERREIDRLGIIDKERRVRVADIGADRRRERADGEIDAFGVHRPGERDFAPARCAPGPYRPQPAHPAAASASSSPATVSIRTRGSPVSRPQQPGDAAGGIAAGLGLAAVGIDGCASAPAPPDGAAARARSAGRSRCRYAGRRARAPLPRRPQAGRGGRRARRNRCRARAS